MRAFVLGGAAGLWEELASARAEFGEPDLIIATNHAGRDFEGEFQHWVTFHGELFPKWIGERQRAGRPDGYQLWSGPSRKPQTILGLRIAENWGGSSGLMAVTVALQLGCGRVILCGVPLDIRVGHYDAPKPWTEGGSYRKAWLAKADLMRPIVRSMSGWTANLIGRPDIEWWTSCQPTRKDAE